MVTISCADEQNVNLGLKTILGPPLLRRNIKGTVCQTQTERQFKVRRSRFSRHFSSQPHNNCIKKHPQYPQIKSGLHCFALTVCVFFSLCRKFRKGNVKSATYITAPHPRTTELTQFIFCHISRNVITITINTYHVIVSISCLIRCIN